MLTIIILRQSSVALRHDSSLRTLEGRLARYMLFLPVGIILGRATYLYAADAANVYSDSRTFLWCFLTACC